jgi:hypothetical protein
MSESCRHSRILTSNNLITIARSFVRSFVCLFVRSFVRSLIRSYVRLIVGSFVRSFIRLSVRSFVRFVRSFVRLFVYSFVRLSSNTRKPLSHYTIITIVAFLKSFHTFPLEIIYFLNQDYFYT